MYPVWLLFVPLSFASFQQDDEQFDELWELGLTHDRRKLPSLMKQYNEHGIGQCFSKKRKSPINIDIGKTTVVSLPPLVFKNYDVSEIVSEGQPSNFTVSVHGYTNWTTKPILSGGPLNEEYHLMEVHWDMDELMRFGMATSKELNFYGHTINNGKQDAEVHFIHTKDGMPVEEALLIPGGVVIVAVFINHAPRSFTDDIFSSFVHPNSQIINFTVPKQPGMDFKWRSPETFFPDDISSCYVYNGTFAHPPCTGDVTWIVFANPKIMVQRGLMIDMNMHKSTNITLTAFHLKNRENPEVLFHPSHNRLSPSLRPSTSTSNALLAALAALIWGVVIGLFCFYVKKKCAEMAIDEDSEDNIPAVKYQIGLDNLSVA